MFQILTGLHIGKISNSMKEDKKNAVNKDNKIHDESDLILLSWIGARYIKGWDLLSTVSPPCRESPMWRDIIKHKSDASNDDCDVGVYVYVIRSLCLCN